jgi:YHS domain-containing protein
MFKKLGMAVIVVCALFVVAGVVTAQEESKTETAPSAVTVTEVTPEAAVNVGNKVCPVTGDKIAELGKDTVEYEGKIYNMCCPMCKDKFLADPAKYIAIVDQELATEKAAAAVTEAPVAAE